jgi:hypothetical protein
MFVMPYFYIFDPLVIQDFPALTAVLSDPVSPTQALNFPVVFSRKS